MDAGATSNTEGFLVAFVSLVALLVGGVASARPALSAEPGLHIEVSADQRVSVSGTSPSLAATLEDLAWRAGFELRGFDADDGPVALHMKDRPLWQALPRLLAGRSFMAGTVPVEGHGQRLVWLRVLGPHDRAHENRRLGRGPSRRTEGFRVPPSLFLAAFGKDRSPEDRGAALQSIAAQITRNSEQRRAFLATEPLRIADALREYPEATGLLKRLGEHQSDIALKEKLNQVLALLGNSVGESPVHSHELADARAGR